MGTGEFFSPEKISGYVWMGPDLSESVLYEKGDFILDTICCWEVNAVAHRTL